MFSRWSDNFGHNWSLLVGPKGSDARCEREVGGADSVEVAAHFSQLRVVLPRLDRRWPLNLFWLASCNAWFLFDERFDLGKTRLADLALSADNVEQAAKLGRPTRGKIGFFRQHGWDCSDSAALVEQQTEELVADHLLEFGQRQACSGLFPYVLQELKAALIGYAIRHADIEERPYGGLARSTLANAPGQLFGAVGYEGAINAVNTRMPSGAR